MKKITVLLLLMFFAGLITEGKIGLFLVAPSVITACVLIVTAGVTSKKKILN